MHGREQTTDRVHPFRKYFDELEIGETLDHASPHGHGERRRELRRHLAATSSTRTWTTSRRASRSSRSASRTATSSCRRRRGCSSIRRRVPVLANYGLEGLRFVKPVYIGDTIQARLTCKQKTAKEDREGQIPQGVVHWDVEVTQPGRRAGGGLHDPHPRQTSCVTRTVILRRATMICLQLSGQ